MLVSALKKVAFSLLAFSSLASVSHAGMLRSIAIRNDSMFGDDLISEYKIVIRNKKGEFKVFRRDVERGQFIDIFVGLTGYNFAITVFELDANVEDVIGTFELSAIIDRNDFASFDYFSEKFTIGWVFSAQ